MLTIHIGVRESELNVLKDQIDRVSEGVKLVANDTPWNPDGYERVQHIEIDTMTPLTVINMLATRFDIFLEPSQHFNMEGTKLIVTDKGDPMSEYVEFRYPS